MAQNLPGKLKEIDDGKVSAKFISCACSYDFK